MQQQQAEIPRLQLAAAGLHTHAALSQPASTQAEGSSWPPSQRPAAAHADSSAPPSSKAGRGGLSGGAQPLLVAEEHILQVRFFVKVFRGF
jgi:hypothetical protein